jgi:CRP-like cAMP-binding protein
MTQATPPIMEAVIQKLMQRSHLSVAAIDALLRLPLRKTFFKKGSYVVRQGDRVDAMIALATGYAHSSRSTGHGGRQITAFQIAGEIISSHDNLLPLADECVRAATDLEVVHVTREAMSAVIGQHPAIGTALSLDRQVAASVAKEWLLTVGRRNARQRVAHLLCELADRQSAAGLSSEGTMTLPMTQEMMADAVGLTAVHVNRTIQGLRSDHIIRSAGQTITVMNLARLRAEGDYRQAYLYPPDQLAA